MGIKKTYRVEGMHCASCATNIEKAVKKVKGIASARVNFSFGKLYIDGDNISEKELKETIKKTGDYKIFDDEETSIELKISGMTCTSCANRIEKNLNSLDGIIEARVNFANSKAYIKYDSSKTNLQEIINTIKKTGYNVLKEKKKSENYEENELNKSLRRMQVAAAFAIPIMVLMMVHMFIWMIPYYLIIIAILAFPVIFIVGWNTHKSAIRSVINLSPNMDTLVTLGSLIPYLLSLLGFWFPITTFIEMAASILTLHLVGRYLEARAKGRASEAIKKLLSLGAKKANIIKNNQEIEIPIEELKVDDIMIIRPGEKYQQMGLLSVEKQILTNQWLLGNQCQSIRKKVT